jgi:hypothetical protein
MKRYAIAITAFTFALVNLGWAQGATNFAMVGITRDQTLQLNLAAFPDGPCAAQLGFQDSKGNPVGPTSSVTLTPGQSASLSLPGNALIKKFGQRAEVLPTVAPDATYPSVPCRATAEVVENILANTTVLAEGDANRPVLGGALYNGPLGITVFQTARLNVVAYSPNPCIAMLGFADNDGNPIGKPMSVNLNPGQAAFLDLLGTAVVRKIGQRAEVQPVVNVNGDGVPNACIASTEVYDNFTGQTNVYYPPTPNAPSSTITGAGMH